jgi:hypothetical protein
MARKGLLILATIILLGAVAAGSGTASADVRRERLARRPYITEVGYPYAINARRLQYEIAHLTELQEYIQDYGYPDYAEIQEVSPDWPWVPYEVRLYYLRSNLEAAFGPVLLSPAMPNLGVLKFRGDITPEKRHEIDLVLQSREKPAVPAPVRVSPAANSAATQPAADPIEAAVGRIEVAAERAAQAADSAVAASEAAVRAADRTVNLVYKMQEGAGIQR